MFKKPAFALLAAATLATAAVPAASTLAQSGGSSRAAAALSAADRATVEQAAAYLQGLNSARGRFTQTAPNGSVTRGTFYLKRPGKIRFEYDAPAKLLVVADGYNVKIYDERLKTFDQYPLGRTPLSLFLAKNIDLTRGGVTGVTRTGDGFSLTARDARRQAEGSITLGFSDGPVALREWTVTDPQGRRTRVRVDSLTPQATADGLYVLRDPTRRPTRR